MIRFYHKRYNLEELRILYGNLIRFEAKFQTFCAEKCAICPYHNLCRDLHSVTIYIAILIAQKESKLR